MSQNMNSFEVLQRFAMLEKTLHRPLLQPYDPLPGFRSDSVQLIHEEAMHMLLYAGLMNYRPSVTYTSLKDETAGDVCINNNADNIVYIRISEKFKHIPQAVLYILAHEICHKVLYVYGFPIVSGIENEYYTDLATFYMGFGQQVMDGHICKQYNETHTLGYLSDETYQRAFVLSNICFHNDSIQSCYLQKQQLPYDTQMASIMQASVNAPVPAPAPTDFFLRYTHVHCPECSHRSGKSHPELICKKVRCPECKKEFLFELSLLPADPEKVAIWENLTRQCSQASSSRKSVFSLWQIIGWVVGAAVVIFSIGRILYRMFA